MVILTEHSLRFSKGELEGTGMLAVLIGYNSHHNYCSRYACFAPTKQSTHLEVFHTPSLHINPGIPERPAHLQLTWCRCWASRKYQLITWRRTRICAANCIILSLSDKSQ